MDKKNIGIAQGLMGELSTDYFDFYCTKCGDKIPNVVFYAVDTVGVQLLARCKPCDFSYIFKIKTKPTLGPIQIISEFGKTSYKLYDRRRLKKYLKKQVQEFPPESGHKVKRNCSFAQTDLGKNLQEQNEYGYDYK